MTFLKIPGVSLQRPEVHQDDRGFFLEIVRMAAEGPDFVQSNHSHSQVGVLRGLHYHRHQADLWYVVSGEAQVGLVDLRDKSAPPTASLLTLTADHPQTLFIPPGVAHGFLAITDVNLIYWVTNYYNSTDEFGVAWNDPALGLDWADKNPTLSERDRRNPPLQWESIPDFS